MCSPTVREPPGEQRCAAPTLSTAINAAGRLAGVQPGRLDAAMLSVALARSATAVGTALGDWLAHLATAPQKRRALSRAAVRQAVQLARYAMRATVAPGQPSPFAPEAHDRRFLGEGWSRWPFNLIAQAFLMTDCWREQATTDVPGVSRHNEDLVAFVTRQILDTLSPSNFPVTNPEILATTIAERGANLQHGARNLSEDWKRFLSGRRPLGAENFSPGKQVALTPGAVVYRNSLLELIQYAPQTPLVYSEPVLLVPASILKYYLLDLSLPNSLVRYLVCRGHSVFAISWKNPKSEDHDIGFDDYLRTGLMAALDAVAAIVPGRRIHAAGYCLGGTLLALAAAAMAGAGYPRLQTLTLFAVQVDFADGGELSTFIDEDQVASLETLMQAQGYLDTRQLVVPVLLLRARDFLWPLLVQQYLLGRREPMTDLMAWRTDATRLPTRMYSEYLRRFPLGNELAQGRYSVDGRQVRVSDLDLPIFAVGALDDFIAPWRSVFRIHFLTDAEVTFVLTDGDHHGGIIADPEEPHRRFEIATSGRRQARLDADGWRERASPREGRWWSDWQKWLSRHSSDPRDPPLLGDPRKGYPPLGRAPGTYVLQR